MWLVKHRELRGTSELIPDGNISWHYSSCIGLTSVYLEAFQPGQLIRQREICFGSVAGVKSIQRRSVGQEFASDPSASTLMTIRQEMIHLGRILTIHHLGFITTPSWYVPMSLYEEKSVRVPRRDSNDEGNEAKHKYWEGSCNVIAWQQEAEVLGWVVRCLFFRDVGCLLLVQVYQRVFLVL